MGRLGLRRFDELAFRLVPKNSQDDILVKTKSSGTDTDIKLIPFRPVLLAYAKVPTPPSSLLTERNG